MKRLIAVLVAVLLPARAAAQPSISSVSGTIDAGRTITISGSNFGTKAQAAPRKWDTFEGGTLNANLGGGWNLLAVGGSTVPQYSNTVLRPNTGSTRSARASFLGGQWTSAFGYEYEDWSVAYIDAWYYYAPIQPSRNHKIFRLHANWATTIEPNIYLNIYCSISSHLAQDNVSGSVQNVWFDLQDDYFINQWRHIQAYLQASGAGQSNGVAELWIDGQKYVNEVGTFRTRDAGEPTWDALWLGQYFGTSEDEYCAASTGGYTYWDDVYLDKSPLRVELSNNATYNNATHREIQIPTAWSSTSITATVNLGSFQEDDSVYVCVTSGPNQHDCAGPFTVGGEGGGDPPPSSGGNWPRLRIRWRDMGLLVVSAVVPLHRRGRRLMALLLMLMVPALASAQPSISSVSGTLEHGSSVTITGSGFGTKAQAAPVKWVTMETGSPGSDWDTVRPTTASVSAANMAYSTGFKGMEQAHARSLRYAHGCHEDNDPNGGTMVSLGVAYQQTAYPAYSYWNYWSRTHPNWVPDDFDRNYKFYSVNNDSVGGLFDQYWYINFAPDVFFGYNSPASGLTMQAHDSGGLGYRCISTNGAGECSSTLNTTSWFAGLNPTRAWFKPELLIRWDRTNSGRVVYIENGSVQLDSNGATDLDTTRTWRSEMIGGFARINNQTPTDSCRYFDDVYFDRSWARVLLGNAPTFNASTVREPQPATSWSDTSITVTFNAGWFADDTTAYLYVCAHNSSNPFYCNSNGYQVTIASAEEPQEPEPSSGGRMRRWKLRMPVGDFAFVAIGCAFVSYRVWKRQ